jgi:hypothetical protein
MIQYVTVNKSRISDEEIKTLERVLNLRFHSASFQKNKVVLGFTIMRVVK